MKKIAILLLLLGISAGLFAQDGGKPLISVLDFRASDISRAEVELFVDFMTSHIVETGRYRVLDRSQRQAILQEIEFSASDCSDESCQLEIGRLLAANQIIVGSLGRIGGQYILNIKLLDVQTGEAMNSTSKVYTSIDNLVNDSKRLTYLLLQTDFQGLEKAVQQPEAETSPDMEPEAEMQPKRPPSNRGAGGERFNTVYLTASFEFWDEDLYLLLNYSRHIIPSLGVNIGAGIGFMYGEFTVLGGLFADLSRLRVYANAGWDSWAGFLVSASVMFEVGRFCVGVDGGLTFDSEDFRLGVVAGYVF